MGAQVTLPHTSVGLGLRTPLFESIDDQKPDSIGFLEIHPENFFGGGLNLDYLHHIAKSYPISVHGVALSLGSADGLDQNHLTQLKELIDSLPVCRVSEHLAWVQTGGKSLNDLLPLPLNDESLDVVARNIDKTQSFLARQILIENPSSYLTFNDSSYSEMEFMAKLVEQTGCGVLLDVNNIYVSCQNHGWSESDYVDQIELIAPYIGEIHMAGHLEHALENTPETILIDDHGAPVSDPVWALYQNIVERYGVFPTCIERDNNIPALANLLQEVEQASTILKAQQHDHKASA